MKPARRTAGSCTSTKKRAATALPEWEARFERAAVALPEWEAQFERAAIALPK
jgi:hypothetical protein